MAIAAVGSTDLLEPTPIDEAASAVTEGVAEPLPATTAETTPTTQPLAGLDGSAESTLEEAQTVTTSPPIESAAPAPSTSPADEPTAPDRLEAGGVADPVQDSASDATTVVASPTSDVTAAGPVESGSLAVSDAQPAEATDPVESSSSDTIAAIPDAMAPLVTTTSSEAVPSSGAEPDGSTTGDIEAASSATSTLETTVDSVATTVTATSDLADEVTAALVETSPETPPDLLDIVVASATAAVVSTTDAIEANVLPVVSETTNAVTGAAEIVSDSAATTTGTLVDPQSGTQPPPSESGSTPLETTVRSLIDAVENTVTDPVGTVEETASDPVGTVEETVAPVIEAASAAVREAAPTTGSLGTVQEATTQVGTLETTVLPAVDSASTALREASATDPIGDTLADPVGTVGGAVSDPVGTVGGAVSDPVGTVGEAVSDPVGSVGGAVTGTADSFATSAGLVSSGESSGTPSGTSRSDSYAGDQSTSTSDDARASDPASSSGASGSMTAMQRDARAPWSADAVDLMATARPDVASPDIQSETRCAVGGGLMCSLMNNVMGFGSLVDAVTSVIRSLALTGLTLLPWLAATLALGTIGVFTLRLTRDRSTRAASLGGDSWVYPEAVR